MKQKKNVYTLIHSYIFPAHNNFRFNSFLEMKDSSPKSHWWQVGENLRGDRRL